MMGTHSRFIYLKHSHSNYANHQWRKMPIVIKIRAYKSAPPSASPSNNEFRPGNHAAHSHPPPSIHIDPKKFDGQSSKQVTNSRNSLFLESLLSCLKHQLLIPLSVKTHHLLRKTNTKLHCTNTHATHNPENLQ